MAKANKKSLDAKAYINGKVNDMREQFHKASDEGTKKQLVENFRETTSSEEYQENLQVVHDDTDVIRKYAKRQKGGDITSEEFKDAKTEFYGKDMNLNLGEDFDKMDEQAKCKYIIDKFGHTQYSFDCLMKYKLVGKINNEDRNNFSNLNNKSAQSLLLDKEESYYKRLFFSHMDKFGTFDNKTLDIMADKYRWFVGSFEYIPGAFSKKDTNYILNKLKEKHGGHSEGFLCRLLLSNYDKFTLKNGLDGMVDYLYENFMGIYSKGKINDFITIRKDRRENKRNSDYKLSMNDVKILKVLKTIGTLSDYEGDKIAKILLNSGKYDGGLKFLMTKYYGLDDKGKECLYLTKDMVSRIASYFSEKNKNN